MGVQGAMPPAGVRGQHPFKLTKITNLDILKKAFCGIFQQQRFLLSITLRRERETKKKYQGKVKQRLLERMSMNLFWCQNVRSQLRKKSVFQRNQKSTGAREGGRKGSGERERERLGERERERERERPGERDSSINHVGRQASCCDSLTMLTDEPLAGERSLSETRSAVPALQHSTAVMCSFSYMYSTCSGLQSCNIAPEMTRLCRSLPRTQAVIARTPTA